MLKIRSLLAGCAAVLLASAAVASDKPPFPRTAGVNMGGPHNYDDPAYQAKLAKLNFSVLAMYPGWGGSASAMDSVVRGIKAINPQTRVFLYENSMEVDITNTSFAPVTSKVDQMKWWAYASGTSTRLKSTYGTEESKPVYLINTTLNTPRDANGHQYWEWNTRWTVQQMYKPNPSMDGFFEDNVFWRPRVNADWNRDGTIDSATGANAGKWLREGYRSRFTLMRSLMPGKYVIGNIADWGQKEAVLTELQGTLHGGIIEGILGPSYSPERWGSWTEMMRWYRKTMAALADPKLAVFHMIGNPLDYQALRYGLGSCMLDDGYFAFTVSGQGYTGVPWFDEYDAKLGQPTKAPPTVAWQNGVFRRDFENGIVLVNPKGNGVREVTLEEDFKRIAGKQAPSVNNGQTTRKLTLQDRDGIVLLRIKPQALPSAPKLTAVQ